MLNLVNWLRRFSVPGRNATKLYGSIVTQARQPVFFMRFGVPDTPNGRFEVLALHLVLVLRALRRCEGADGPVGRALVERFVTDMDDSMREMAVGDMSVPRKVKKVAGGLVERSRAYQGELDGGDGGELARQIATFVHGRDEAAAGFAQLADYAREVDEDLAHSPCHALIDGQIQFTAIALDA